MSGPLRSKQGCWTCRLRKKKCDEGRPLCSLCTSLSITCYGYGPRPAWMDNGEKEKAVANGIKEIVKHTSRRKPTTQLPRQRDQPIGIAPNSNGSMESSSSHPASNRQHDTPPPSDHGSSQEDGVQVVQEGSTVSLLVVYQWYLILIASRMSFLLRHLGRSRCQRKKQPS